MDVCKGISSSPHSSSLHQPHTSAPLPSPKANSKGPKGRQAGGRVHQLPPHRQPQLFQAPCPARGQGRGGALRRPEGAAGSCGLPFPSLHPFVRRSIFLPLKESEGEKS